MPRCVGVMSSEDFATSLSSSGSSDCLEKIYRYSKIILCQIVKADFNAVAMCQCFNMRHPHDSPVASLAQEGLSP